MIAEINDLLRERGAGRSSRAARNTSSRRNISTSIWPADEYIFVKLTAEGKFDAFYARGRQAAGRDGCARASSGLPMDVIDEAIQLNHALVHQPFAKTDLKVKLRYDLLDYWHKVRGGEQALLAEKPMVVEIDRTSKALRRLPEVVPRDRLVGQQEGRLPLYAQRHRHHPRARRPHY